MNRKVLKNKPLVEAIFEVRWQLQSDEAKPEIKIDPHYKLLIGRLYDKLNRNYPFHEQLPAALIPDEMLEGVVQHRFRKGKDMWPLIQIGPGILTVNDTDGYVWEDFERRIIEAVNALFEIYPDSNNLSVESLMLRYIDAIEFDFEKEDIFKFLREQMKIEISLHPPLFEETPVEALPVGFDWRFSFRCIKPTAAINLRFNRGKKKNGNSDRLIWETIVHSTSDGVPELPSELGGWLTDAHNVTDDWFFKLIEGDLLRRFE